MKAFYMMESGSAREQASKQVPVVKWLAAGFVARLQNCVYAGFVEYCIFLYDDISMTTCCGRSESNFVFIFIPPLRARLPCTIMHGQIGSGTSCMID